MLHEKEHRNTSCGLVHHASASIRRRGHPCRVSFAGAGLHGASHRSKGIEEGDILVIDKSLELIEGDLAVCYVDGEFTVKRVSIEGDTVWLVPSNPSYPRIKVTADNDFMVWGIVTYTIKKNRRRR